MYACVCNLDPPPVNNPIASHSKTPTDLSGFDIIISWDVSHTYIHVCSVIKL